MFQRGTDGLIVFVSAPLESLLAGDYQFRRLPHSSMTSGSNSSLAVSRELAGYASAEHYPRLPHWIAAIKS
jgi:hypothetical protein